jgi:ABC-2 type transport system permease protein
MNKVLLIIQREYLTRVKKKSFVVTTLLVPGLIIVMYAVIALIYSNSDEINAKHLVRVHDESGIFKGKFHNKKTIVFVDADKPIDASKADLKKNHDDFLLIIDADFAKKDGVQILSQSKPDFTTIGTIEDQMNTIASNNSMIKAGIDTAKLNSIKSDISIKAI